MQHCPPEVDEKVLLTVQPVPARGHTQDLETVHRVPLLRQRCHVRLGQRQPWGKLDTFQDEFPDKSFIVHSQLAGLVGVPNEEEGRIALDVVCSNAVINTVS